MRLSRRQDLLHRPTAKVTGLFSTKSSPPTRPTTRQPTSLILTNPNHKARRRRKRTAHTAAPAPIAVLVRLRGPCDLLCPSAEASTAKISGLSVSSATDFHYFMRTTYCCKVFPVCRSLYRSHLECEANAIALKYEQCGDCYSCDQPKPPRYALCIASLRA